MLDFSASMSDWSVAFSALRFKGLPIQPKVPKISKRGQMVQNFWERLKKIWELLNFKKVSHPSENSGYLNVIKISGNRVCHWKSP